MEHAVLTIRGTADLSRPPKPGECLINGVPEKGENRKVERCLLLNDSPPRRRVFRSSPPCGPRGYLVQHLKAGRSGGRGGRGEALGRVDRWCVVHLGRPSHTVDYWPFIKSQLAQTQLSLRPSMEHIWSRCPPSSGGSETERTADALS